MRSKLFVLLALTACAIVASTTQSPASNVSSAFVPSGMIFAFGGATCPAGSIATAGASHLRTLYPTLYAAIGCANGCADGTHFNVPDTRGLFLRAVDAGSGRDPNAGTRTAQATGGNTGDAVGSLETDAFQGHWHTLTGYQRNNSPGTANIVEGPFGGQLTSNAGFAQGSISDGSNGTPRTSSESRPKNLNVLYCIKI